MLALGPSLASSRCLLFPAGGSCTLDVVDYDFRSGGQENGEGENATTASVSTPTTEHRGTSSFRLPEEALSVPSASERLSLICRAAASARLLGGDGAANHRTQLLGLDPRSPLIVDRSDEPLPTGCEQPDCGESSRSRMLNASASNSHDSLAQATRLGDQLRGTCAGVSRWLRGHRDCEHFFLRVRDVVERSLYAASWPRPPHSKLSSGRQQPQALEQPRRLQ